VSSYANPQSLNRYGYALNNPLRYLDPTGHQPCGDGERVDCSGNLNNPPNGPPPSSGTTGQHTGTHGNNDGNTTPPVVVVPPIDIGPGGIIIVPLPGTDLSSNSLKPECKSLEHQFFGVLSQVRNLANNIIRLQRELASTTEPERREELQNEIDSLVEQQINLLKKLEAIRATANALDCNTLGWP
jgi:hypothetical protein